MAIIARVSIGRRSNLNFTPIAKYSRGEMSRGVSFGANCRGDNSLATAIATIGRASASRSSESFLLLTNWSRLRSSWVVRFLISVREARVTMLAAYEAERGALFSRVLSRAVFLRDVLLANRAITLRASRRVQFVHASR